MSFFEFLRETRAYGLAYTLSRYYGIYPGEIGSTEDEQAQQRVKVKAPAVTHRKDEIAAYAYPVTPYGGKDKGFVFPPDPGDPAWVAFDEGKPSFPRYLGSWWTNSDAQGNPKDPSFSALPAEFRPADGKRPTARGFKTQRGHGLLMEDDEQEGHRVELWTGEQEEEGKAATRHHEVLLSDADGYVEIATYGTDAGGSRLRRHVRLDDTEEFVEVKSAGSSASEFHRLRLDDKNKEILIQTTEARHVVLSDANSYIEVKTGDYSARFDESAQKVEVKADTRKVVLDQTASTIEISAPDQSIKLSPSGTKIADQTGQPVEVESSGDLNGTATGNLGLQIGGSATISVGGSVSETAASKATTLQGDSSLTAATRNVLLSGAYSLIASAAQITAATITLLGSGPNSIQLGTGGQHLLNEAALAKYNAHTHIVTGALPGVAIATAAVMIPLVDTTQTTVAA